MLILLIVSNLILLLLLLEAIRRGLSCRAWLRAIEGEFDSPIPVVRLPEFHDLFAQSELGSTLRTEVLFVGGGALGGTTDSEAWVLAVLAKQAHCMFEFGTCTGRTTYLLARNSAPEARVNSLTLGSDHHQEYSPEQGDNPLAAQDALTFSAFTTFLYSGTPVDSKVFQLFGDSKRFDETPYLQRCDLIFIDGSHAYSYVKNDTEKALRMLKTGGIILWHDYRYRSRETGDVRRWLDELNQTLPLVRLHGTTLVAYRAARAED